MNAEAEHSRPLHELAREVHVLLGRRRIPRGMVVEQDDGRRRRSCGFAEHFPGMGRTRIERSDRNERGAQQTMFRIKQHDAELFDRPRPELWQ